MGGDNKSSGGPKGLEGVTRPEDFFFARSVTCGPSCRASPNSGTKRRTRHGGRLEKAENAFESLQSVWFEVEGTVGDKSRSLYERIETAQGLISDGVQVKNVDRVVTGSSNQAAAIQEFMDTYQ